MALRKGPFPPHCSGSDPDCMQSAVGFAVTAYGLSPLHGGVHAPEGTPKLSGGNASGEVQVELRASFHHANTHTHTHTYHSQIEPSNLDIP